MPFVSAGRMGAAEAISGAAVGAAGGGGGGGAAWAGSGKAT